MELEDEMMEYTVFTVDDKEGKELEMAVIDEFELDGNAYVTAALVEGDTISEDGYYIYKVKADAEEFAVEKITDEEEYKKVALAYMEMDTEE